MSKTFEILGRILVFTAVTGAATFLSPAVEAGACGESTAFEDVRIRWDGKTLSVDRQEVTIYLRDLNNTKKTKVCWYSDDLAAGQKLVIKTDPTKFTDRERSKGTELFGGVFSKDFGASRGRRGSGTANTGGTWHYKVRLMEDNALVQELDPRVIIIDNVGP